MISKMIRPRPSAFSRYFVKPVYLQNFKPQFQIRNLSAYSQKEPDNEPPFWLLVAAGCCILYNLCAPPKKEN